MATILKVQLNEEIRRISLDAPITLANLESKIRSMFAQQLLDSQKFSIYSTAQSPSSESKLIANERDLQEAFLMAVFSSPPILRLIICPGVVQPTLEPLTSVSGFLDEATLSEPTIEVFYPCLASDDDDIISSTSTSSSVVIVDDDVNEDPSTPAQPLYPCIICGQKNALNKCLNCLSVYICDECSLDPSSMHNTEHVWIRLTKAISELPLKTQLLLVSHLDKNTDRNDTRTERKRLRAAIRKEAQQVKQDRLRLRKKNQRQKRVTRQQERKAKNQQDESVNSEIMNELDVVCDGIIESVNALDRSLNHQDYEDDDLTNQLRQLEPLPESEDTFVANEFVENAQMSLSGLMTELLAAPTVNSMIVSLTDEDVDDEVLPVTIVTPQVDTSQYTIAGISFNEKLAKLETMGFTDRRRNMFYLIKNLSSLERTVADLLG